MPQTISQLLSYANKSIHLYEAEILLARALKKSKEHIIAHPEINVGFFNSRKYKWLVKKRQKGTPIAYLTGHKEFFGLDFLVNKYTLIPRPDTELMVEAVLNNIEKYQLQHLQQFKHLLIDIGTGSGCIPISIIKTSKHQNIKTLAVDLSKKALRVAKRNAKKHNLKITFLHGNLLKPILTYKHLNIQTYKHILITANLPYLTEEQFLSEKSIQHEPKSALIAKDDGLALYKELLQQIKQLITNYPDLLEANQVPTVAVASRLKSRILDSDKTESGQAIPILRDAKSRILDSDKTESGQATSYLEIDPTQSKKIKALINKILPNAIIEVKKDLSGHDRLIIINLN